MLTVGIISLGCPKNQSDSEVLIGRILESGMQLTADPREADAVVINTCSFILDARKESLDAVKEMAREAKRRRKNQKPLKIVVAGCMPQRYGEKVREMIPQADAFIGIDELEKIDKLIAKLCGNATKTAGENAPVPVSVTKRPRYIPDYATPRARLTLPHIANVKIAEGCNHGCAFCAIPGIRGKHRSRAIDDIVAEVKTLVQANGVKEINLISQDTTYFGMDTWKKTRVGKTTKVSSEEGDSLATLLRALNRIRGDFWIRVFYTHPAHWSDELISVFAKCKKVVPYVDIPLQHISDAMLSAMNRETDGKYIRDLIAKIRKGIPNVTIRSTFIVGFPGETKADFEELTEFLDEQKFDRVGVFQYSKEENTSAALMQNQVVPAEKVRRWNASMVLLQKISRERMRSRVGEKIRVLVDEPGIARTAGDGFEVDGVVYVPKTLPVGEFAEVTVTGYKAYDLIAK
ncbi:MAG: 30S ribosomal protein S12 methylthiotransferase RimO [Opitutales bacterium]|nr:30S ribosomal protein S12 methylthiotransferase RimO [Opitutales bacterium]